MTPTIPPSILDQISTRWSAVSDPLQFVYRYGQAIRAYLAALIPDRHDAEDVTQDFLLKMLQQSAMIPERVKQGRFRDYLKAALRNGAIDHFRRKAQAARRTGGTTVESLAARETSADSDYTRQWRQILLERCWDHFELLERTKNDNFGFSALRLGLDRPDDDSKMLAAELSVKAGRPISAEAFRKQRSRARKTFAQFLVEEVRQTLEHPTANSIIEELTDLGLLKYVRDYLPTIKTRKSRSS